LNDAADTRLRDLRRMRFFATALLVLMFLIFVATSLAEGEWPWEADERIAHACRRGYEHLPPAGRALPLV